MARGYRYAYTTSECKRIEISFLLKNELIVKGATVTGVILDFKDQSGAPTGSIGIESKYTPEEKYIRLHYTITNSWGESRDMDYKIELYGIPSNLGRGEVLYFADYTGLYKILYLAYGSEKFMSREAYRGYWGRNIRLYYPLQISSRMSRENDKYFILEKKLKSLGEMRATYTYRGVKTRRADRIDKLRDKKEIADLKRWSPEFMPKALLRVMLKDLQESKNSDNP